MKQVSGTDVAKTQIQRNEWSAVRYLMSSVMGSRGSLEVEISTKRAESEKRVNSCDSFIHFSQPLMLASLALFSQGS